MDARNDAILVVDDDPVDVELVQRALRRLAPSANVVVARNGEEALNLLFGRDARSKGLAALTLRAVLLDLHMPGTDGFDVLGKVKSDAILKSVPVIVLTSSKEPKDVERCYRLGANSYTVKPVAAEQYDEVIGHIAQYWLTINEPDPAHSPIALLHN